MKTLITSIALFALSTLFGQCQNFHLYLTGTDPNCYGISDGSIAFSVSGNNGNFTLTITNSSGATVPIPSWNQLPQGIYYGAAVDDSGCVAVDNVTLLNPPEILPQITIIDPTHLDSCNGSVEVDTVLNYQGNYTALSYFWSPGGPGGIGETVKSDLCHGYYSLTINDETGCSSTVQVASGSASIPSEQIISGITLYPNPVKNKQTLQFSLNESAQVTITLQSVEGKIVKTLDSKEFSIGLNSPQYDLSDLPDGTFIYCIQLENGQIFYQKMIKY